MAIYTRFGGEVHLCAARLIPVWVVRLPSEVKWFYTKPTRKYRNVREVPIWHYRGNYADGKPVCDGKWIDTGRLVADGGWPEIQARLDELCPDGEAQYRAWDKKGAPEASRFFPPIDEREAA